MPTIYYNVGLMYTCIPNVCMNIYIYIYIYINIYMHHVYIVLTHSEFHALGDHQAIIYIYIYTYIYIYAPCIYCPDTFILFNPFPPRGSPGLDE